MNGLGLGDWFMLLFVVAAVYVLVRPRSKAAEFVTSIGGMMTAMVRRATDIAA